MTRWSWHFGNENLQEVKRKERKKNKDLHSHTRKKKKKRYIRISSSCNSCFSTVGDIIKEAVARLSHHIYRPQSSSSLIFINFIFLLFVLLLLFYLYLYTVMMRKGKLRIDARWHWLKNSPTTSRITKWESSTSSNTWARIDERRW